MKQNKKNPDEENLNSRLLYPIGVVSELLGVTTQTLRLYEEQGLLKTKRRGRNRYYSEDDLTWLKCVRRLIHEKKVSIEGVKLVIKYAPCWEITDCPDEVRNKCTAFHDRSKPCWEINQMVCQKGISVKYCKKCPVFVMRSETKP